MSPQSNHHVITLVGHRARPGATAQVFDDLSTRVRRDDDSDDDLDEFFAAGQLPLPPSDVAHDVPMALRLPPADRSFAFERLDLDCSGAVPPVRRGACLAYNTLGELARAHDEAPLRLCGFGGAPFARPLHGSRAVLPSCSLPALGGPCDLLCWSRDGQRLAQASQFGAQLLFIPQHPGAMQGVHQVLLAHDGLAYLPVGWHPQTDAMIESRRGHRRGKLVSVLFERRAGSETLRRRGPTVATLQKRFVAPVTHLLDGPDGSVTVAVDVAGRLYALSRDTWNDGQVAKAEPLAAPVRQVAWSPDGLLAVLCTDGSFCFFWASEATLVPLRTLPPKQRDVEKRATCLVWFDDYTLALGVHCSLLFLEMRPPDTMTEYVAEFDRPIKALSKNPRCAELAITWEDGVTSLLQFDNSDWLERL